MEKPYQWDIFNHSNDIEEIQSQFLSSELSRHGFEGLHTFPITESSAAFLVCGAVCTAPTVKGPGGAVF